MKNIIRKANKVIRNPRLLLTIPKRVRAQKYIKTIDNLIVSNFINGKKNDTILLASYPKSGNTFFRFVWLNLIFLQELERKEIDFVILDEYMPFEGFLDDLQKEWEFDTLPCLLKTHRSFEELYNPLRSIHLFRNPLDTMISSYNYLSKRVAGAKNLSTKLERKIFNHKDIRFTGNFSQYLEKNFDEYCSHFSSWMKYSDSFPISYEILLSDSCLEAMMILLDHLGYKTDQSIVLEAINRSQPSKLKNAPPSDKMAQLEMKFIRDASTEQYKGGSYFGDRELEFVRNKLKEYSMHRIDLFPEKYQTILEKNRWTDVW